MKISPLLVIGSIVLIFICFPAASSIEARQTSIAATPTNISTDLQTIINRGIGPSDVPGIEAGVVTPSWTWEGAAGNASPITGEKAVPGMKFFIASVTKVFTSVAVQKLAEEGRLSLEDPISRWLDPALVAEIPNGKNCTIRELLDHTSGIADYNEEMILREELANTSLAVPYETGIRQGINASPLFPPGADYEYSNVNYLLLTKVVDKASGEPFEEYVNKTIFLPAGLTNTTFHRTNYFSGPHMTATEEENGTVIDFTNLSLNFDRGAGDIVSTTADLNRFHQALRDGALISNISFVDMERSSPQANKTEGTITTGYGLGYGVRNDWGNNTIIAGHSGSYPGSFTFWYCLPEKETYLTLNVNSVGKSGNITEGVFFSLVQYLSR